MIHEHKKSLTLPTPEQESTDKGDGPTVQTSRWGNWVKRMHAWLDSGRILSQTRKAIVLDDLIDSASPGVDFFVLTILSCTIATFGLIVNSPAVIIGAMLVAPLMSPILALSMASISGLSRLFRRSLTAVLEGLGVAVALSALLSFVAFRLPFGPLANFSNEILARTKPSLIDLGIALGGGIAATYALAHPRLSAALPGVAIATALMPPICTIGIGIAFLNPSIFLGAALLFATNLAAIAFAGIITFAVLGFGPGFTSNKAVISHSLLISTIIIVAIGIPLSFFAWNSISESRMVSAVRTVIFETTSELTQNRLVDLSIISNRGIKEISAVLRTSRELSYEEVLVIQSIVSDRIGSPVSLEIVTVPMQVIKIPNP